MIHKTPKYLISVIIPTYNLAEYIEACLDCLEKQTLPKESFEAIVVDDCSTDNTVAIARNFPTSLNLTISQLDKNGGPGIARNQGIDLAQGKYILFLDGDDFLIPNALARLSELMRVDDLDLITFNWTYFSDLKDNPNFVSRRRDLIDMPLEHDALVQHYLGMNMDGSVIYTTAKKSMFEEYQIRFPDGFHEDMAVIFEMYYGANTILKLDEVLYIKNDVEGSIVNTLSKKHVDGYLDAWPTILKFLKKQEPAIDIYMPQYLRGMSGHVCTVISKNFGINQGNFNNRELIYRSILEALDRDENLKKPYANFFPNVTPKDKVAQSFFAHMFNTRLPFSERAKRFESEYFSRI